MLTPVAMVLSIKIDRLALGTMYADSKMRCLYLWESCKVSTYLVAGVELSSRVGHDEGRPSTLVS
jgi:hypothetical protein